MASASPFTTGGHDFRKPFLMHLEWMIGKKDPDIGQLLLACSNFGFNGVEYDEAARKRNIDHLQQWLDGVADDLRQRLMAGSPIPARDDDTLVFLKIRVVGMDEALSSDSGEVGSWRKIYLPIRSFRPRRAAVEPISELRQPFNEQKFNYHQVVDKESFWHDTFDGVRTSFLYNKFPFAKYHAVIAPDLTKNLPQFLECEYHEWLWGLLNRNGVIPGLGVGYNSLGAFASVNHFHFQLLVSEDRFPVANPQWRHNGGQIEYPTKCECFDDCEKAWAYIERFHRGGIPYNLLYTPSRIYCFPRFFQHIPQHAPWTTGFAFFEIAGLMLTISRDAYNDLSEEAISCEFGKMWI